MIFVCYPKCTTCQKARNWLDGKGTAYALRDIKEENPTAEELRQWWMQSGLPLKRFFNTSGLQYRALDLKDKLPGMDEEAQLALLATDGMLVKRPIVVGKGFVLVGFKESEWDAKIKQSPPKWAGCRQGLYDSVFQQAYGACFCVHFALNTKGQG